VLGYAPDCDDVDPTARPKIFWTHNPDVEETPIPEGEVFINITNACSSPSRGLSRHMSLFLPGARDMRAPLETAHAQVDGLDLVLTASTCIQRRVGKSLRRVLDSAIRSLDRGRIQRALDQLQSFVAIVEGSPSAFTGCGDNEGGALRARALSAIFTLSNL
jgi:hypothetical protein